MRTRELAVAVLVTLLFLALASPAWAEKGDKQLRFGVLYSLPTDDLDVAGETTELDGAFGLQASFEFGVTDLIGVEPGLSFVGHDVEVTEAGFPDLDIGEIDVITLTANVNFHLLQDKKVDLILGPTVGYAFWGDLETSDFGDFSADDEFVYGLNFGVDVPGKGKWGFSGGLTYLFSEISLDGGSADIGVDPLQLKVGASVSF